MWLLAHQNDALPHGAWLASSSLFSGLPDSEAAFSALVGGTMDCHLFQHIYD